MAASSPLSARHIQNMSEAAYLEPHWGYADRAKPCTNDPGSCEYLDVVYHSHDLGMVYSGIFWLTVVAILSCWALVRYFVRSRSVALPNNEGEERVGNSRGTLYRLSRTVKTYGRHYLLPDAARPIFGRVTRAQVLTLVVLTGYLTVWSFVGIVYNTWVTPVKKMPGVYNTRTSLGPFADRVGVLAYALTPLSIMLSSRESVLSLITGLPYQSFNFLHRWLGYIIFTQSVLHTVGWCIVELRLYQPQPIVGIEWIKQLYMIWGVIAMFLLTVMVVLSTPWGIRLTGYEFFRKFHYIIAMIYIGACWGHWAKLSCFMIPSLIVWLIDRGLRLLRTALLHLNVVSGRSKGFSCAQATVTHFDDHVHGDIVRLDFEHPQKAWDVGQHFCLCFPEGSIWQSHPFTPLNFPLESQLSQKHSYIFRAKKGETKKIADLAQRKLAQMTQGKELNTAHSPALSVILNGPYGASTTRSLTDDINVLCIAGGTGITFVLPVLLRLAAKSPSPGRKVALVWVVRRSSDLRWVQSELESLKSCPTLGLELDVFITREAACRISSVPSPSSGSSEINGPDSKAIVPVSVTEKGGLATLKTAQYELDINVQVGRPDLKDVLSEFSKGTTRGRTAVYASGPGEMISDLRQFVASCKDGGNVWTGKEAYDVDLICDDRLEW